VCRFRSIDQIVGVGGGWFVVDVSARAVEDFLAQAQCRIVIEVKVEHPAAELVSESVQQFMQHRLEGTGLLPPQRCPAGPAELPQGSAAPHLDGDVGSWKSHSFLLACLAEPDLASPCSPNRTIICRACLASPVHLKQSKPALPFCTSPRPTRPRCIKPSLPFRACLSFARPMLPSLPSPARPHRAQPNPT
jgi:hypothetical protein